MTVIEQLRYWAEADRQEAGHLQEQIEGLENRLTELRDKRDDLRFRAAEEEATAHFLEETGHKVERVGREARVSWSGTLPPVPAP